MYKDPVFIVGSPRSGTTLLGDILDLHPQIGRWYEPHFVLDHYFQKAPDDCRTAVDASHQVKKYITSAFDDYRRKRGCDIVADKSPNNSLKIPFLREIFPEARFIHLLRDGRDTILSIHREWCKREKILASRKDFLQGLKVLKEFLDEHPFWEHKIAALCFELGSPINLFKGRKHVFYRIRRWNGRVGWGPQYEGWLDSIAQVSTLEFNALQWLKCVQAVLEESQNIESSKFLEVRYQDVLKQPEETLKNILDFLGLAFPKDLLSRLPKLDDANIGKWKNAFSIDEKRCIGPIINPLLLRLGYTEDDLWYNPNPNQGY